MKSFCRFMIVFVDLIGSCCGESERVITGGPVFQCGENGSIIETRSDLTEIRLPSNSHVLYSINTERATNWSNNQRCPLMTWKLIRDFETYLNGNFNFTGANGIVQFKNNKLIPGFNYLLHVMLKNARGRIEEKDFNITFFDGKSENKTIGTLGYLDLKIGTNRIYSTLPLVVNAYATICGEFCYYYFTWTISTNGQEIVLPERSSELFIPEASTLTSYEERCIIRCQIMRSDGVTNISEGSINVYIIDPPNNKSEIQVSLPFQYTTINKGAPISIVPYIYNSRNLQYKIEWVCFLEDILLYGCQGQINSEFYMETGFNQEGNYSITLIVRTDQTERTASCYILILPDVPSIEFVVPHPIKPENGIEISAKVSELRTYCTVEWFCDDGGNLNLKDVLGLTDTVYNISSKDKAFLEELVEFGSITVTKYFKLKLPSPSKAWPGLESKCYRIQISVTCPLIREIYDINTIKERPEDFITVTAQTSLFIPPLPTVDSFDVEAEGNEALWTPFLYRVRNSLKGTITAMLYSYGFTLEGVDVVFYSGIDEFSAKTVFPYSGEHDIETYVEICDFEGRCGRKYGPVVKTVLSHDLDENAILRTFKQKLAEEDFYKVFSYAFIVLHSSELLNQSAKYINIFSLEILSKIGELRGREDSKWAIERLVKNYVAFEGHLKLSDDLKIQISELTHHYFINTRSKREIISDSTDLEKIGDLQEHLKILEHLILNPDNEALAKGRDHILELLNDWMTIACKILFKGQGIPEVELKTIAMAIEKCPRSNPNTILAFEESMWNSTIYLKINRNFTIQGYCCLGHVMLNNFLDNSETYGVNIYNAENLHVHMNVSAEVTVYLPYDDAFSEPLCMVYKEGRSSSCTSSKQYTSFVECVCPTFGYYFLDSTSNINTVHGEKLVSMNITDNFNSTSDVYDYETARRLGRKISYVIILSSLMGFLILCYIIRKLTVFPQQNINTDGFGDTYAYGHAMDEDF